MAAGRDNVRTVPDDDAERLLRRFAADAGRVLPLVALWAHGSLALGDFVPGRSDLDLLAVIGAPVTAAQREDLVRAHESLIRDEPLAAGLHCSYMVSGTTAEPGRAHLTWAHQQLFERPVTPVTRRELLEGARRLAGLAPAAVIPPVTDAELADFVRSDLRDYWLPHTSRADVWLEDIWVDLGMLTLARAIVTLREGRLITKREALGVLADLGAPPDVVSDIRDRRYASAPSPAGEWRERRGELASAFVRQGIQAALRIPD